MCLTGWHYVHSKKCVHLTDSPTLYPTQDIPYTQDLGQINRITNGPIIFYVILYTLLLPSPTEPNTDKPRGGHHDL